MRLIAELRVGFSCDLLMDIRILVVCDIRLYRDGLKEALEQRPNVTVVATAADCNVALGQSHACRPTVVLLEMGVPGSRELIPKLLDINPTGKIVVLGITEEPLAVLACIEAGVSGYVPRDATLDVLIETVEAVARDEVVCSPRITATLFRRVAALAGKLPAAGGDDALTDRELEIVCLIDDGLSNKEIARRLRVKVPTIKNHVHHILEKLGVHRRGAAAAVLRRSRARLLPHSSAD